MALVPLLLLLIVVLVLVGAIVFIGALSRSSSEQDANLYRQQNAELVALRMLVEDLKETAWQHRELDSALSVIMIDTIRSYEMKRRELP